MNYVNHMVRSLWKKGELRNGWLHTWPITACMVPVSCWAERSQSIICCLWKGEWGFLACICQSTSVLTTITKSKGGGGSQAAPPNRMKLSCDLRQTHTHTHSLPPQSVRIFCRYEMTLTNIQYQVNKVRQTAIHQTQNIGCNLLLKV